MNPRQKHKSFTLLLASSTPLSPMMHVPISSQRRRHCGLGISLSRRVYLLLQCQDSMNLLNPLLFIPCCFPPLQYQACIPPSPLLTSSLSGRVPVAQHPSFSHTPLPPPPTSCATSTRQALSLLTNPLALALDTKTSIYVAWKCATRRGGVSVCGSWAKGRCLGGRCRRRGVQDERGVGEMER